LTFRVCSRFRGAKDLDQKYLDKQKDEEKKIKEAAKAMAVDTP
jgi:hypothetical protein